MKFNTLYYLIPFGEGEDFDPAGIRTVTCSYTVAQGFADEMLSLHPEYSQVRAIPEWAARENWKGFDEWPCNQKGENK